LLALAFIANLFAVHAADTNPPPRLTVELRDGSRVIGTSVEKYFRFHSALLGDVKLPIKDVRAVECVATNSAKLTTVNGDTLTVSLANSELNVKTSFGKVDLAASSIRKFTVMCPKTAYAHPPGLVALWAGNEDGIDSAGENNAKLQGGTGFVPGKSGQAFAFRAIGDGVTAPTSGLPVGTSDRTIVCWVYVNSFNPGSETFVAGYGNFGEAGQCYALGFDDSQDHRLIFSQWGEAIKGPSLETGCWHNLAVTSIGNDSIKLYVDGTNVASGSLNFDTPSGSQFHIGQVTAPYCLRQCIGFIDEVCVYNRALTAEEIQAAYFENQQ
jgi:hypothetical protein